MARSPLARISAGGFSVLLSSALLLMIGGLIASDRAMTSAAIAQARTDAQQSALAIEQAIHAHLRAGGTLANVGADSVLQSVIAHGPQVRSAAAVIAGIDTVLVAGDPSTFAHGIIQAASISAGAQASWRFVVAHKPDAEPL